MKPCKTAPSCPGVVSSMRRFYRIDFKKCKASFKIPSTGYSRTKIVYARFRRLIRAIWNLFCPRLAVYAPINTPFGIVQTECVGQLDVYKRQLPKRGGHTSSVVPGSQSAKIYFLLHLFSAHGQLCIYPAGSPRKN